MSLSIVLIIALVEGLTEFIPVSSTGHMILVGHLLGFKGEEASTFEVVIQLGAILSVVVLYWERFVSLFKFRADGFSGTKAISSLALACFPVLLGGFLFYKQIKEHLFGPYTVAWALIVGAGLMLLAERFSKKSTTESLDQITLKQSLIVGIFQCLSLWSGMSRAACTISGGLLSGLSRKASAEFSFIVAVPVMLAAVGYELLKNWRIVVDGNLEFFVVGFIVAFLSGMVAIRSFVAILGRYTLTPFALYRVLLGVFTIYVLG